ncbi:MAG: RNA polymerase sigma-70 factor [Prolixibacteraceae bacterium]|jgi:RNA polymerase sigma-70 factor (ECF subfamily)|nr:RNA polymerase sigma-70 factor [Prolixibacteraceae bacterium]
MKENNGQEHLLGLTEGSEKAFRLIMDHWYLRLYNFANGYLDHAENTKEVLQDVFLKLWDNRQKLAEQTNLNAYLFTLTRNRCIDLIRRERLMLQFRTDKQDEYLRLTENFDALSDPILDDLFALELQAEINRAVSGLPEQCRKVFIMSRTNGLKNKEISVSLELSEKTVESHLTKALKTIKLALEQKFPGSLNLLLIFKFNRNKRSR